jgi:hypothetical protein
MMWASDDMSKDESDPWPWGLIKKILIIRDNNV